MNNTNQTLVENEIKKATKKAKKSTTQKSIAGFDYLRFAVRYAQAKNLEAVAKKFGITNTQASQKATYLRQKGVELPKLARAKNGAAYFQRINETLKKKGLV